MWFITQCVGVGFRGSHRAGDSVPLPDPPDPLDMAPDPHDELDFEGPDTRASITEYQFGTHVVRMEQLADVGHKLTQQGTSIWTFKIPFIMWVRAVRRHVWRVWRAREWYRIARTM